MVRSPCYRGVGAHAPDPWKDVASAVDAAERAGIAWRVARPAAMGRIKG